MFFIKQIIPWKENPLLKVKDPHGTRWVICYKLDRFDVIVHHYSKYQEAKRRMITLKNIHTKWAEDSSDSINTNAFVRGFLEYIETQGLRPFIK